MLKLLDHIFFGGFEQKRRNASRKLVMRYSRGNVSVQLGRFLEKFQLENKRKQADIAQDRLIRRVIK